MGHSFVQTFVVGLHVESRVDCNFDEVMQNMDVFWLEYSEWGGSYFLVNFELLALTLSTRSLSCSNS